MSAPDFLTVAEVVRSGIASKTEVYRWLTNTDPRKPSLPSYRIGRSVRINRTDWIAFLRAHVYQAGER